MTEAKTGTGSCWSCRWQQLGGMTFLGFCTKPAKNNPTGKKDIPANIVDTGCPLWQRKGASRAAVAVTENEQTGRDGL
jgi:hypothetical protein